MNNMSLPSNSQAPRATEYKGSDGGIFRMFDHEEAMRVILAWADHDWPMTQKQAFELRDSLGWNVGPEGRGLFVSKVQVGNESDGFIAFDKRRGCFTSIMMRLTTQIFGGLENEFAHEIDNLYSACMKSMQSKFGKGKGKSDDTSSSHSWYLPSKALVSIGKTSHGVDAIIESPAMKDITDAENAYFEYFGPDAP